jgi:hypothetical protein
MMGVNQYAPVQRDGARCSSMNRKKKIGEGYYEPKSIDLQDNGARCSDAAGTR